MYLAHDQRQAWEYLGDERRISARQPLPEHCRFRIQPSPDTPSAGGEETEGSTAP